MRVRAQGVRSWAATQAGVRGRRQLRDGGHPRDHRQVRGHRRGQAGALQGRRGGLRGQREEAAENIRRRRQGDGVEVAVKLKTAFLVRFCCNSLFMMILIF